jgi:hypothetical protein
VPPPSGKEKRPQGDGARRRPEELPGPFQNAERKNSACDIFLLGKEKETHFAHMRGGIDLPGSGIDLPGKSIPRGIEIPGNLIPHPARRTT